MTAVVETTLGPVQGFIDTHPLSDKSTQARAKGSEPGVQKYLGIPFGRAKRWAQCRPAAAWQTTRECFEYGPAAPQIPGALTPILASVSPGMYPRAHVGISEADMFTVNVYASERVTKGDKVPVMVWIYGGSWSDGAASAVLYDPTNVIRHCSSPIIVVSLNYRVNLFGFFGSKDLVDEDGLVGNYGLRDQLLALKWVKANIAAFGGDAQNVTIFGESAGAASVGYHIGGEDDDLFRRAILQSGAASTMAYQPVEAHEKNWQTLLKHFSIAPDDADRVQKARAIPMKELLKFRAQHPTMQWAACVESGPHAIWSTHPDERIWNGKYPRMLESVMLGCCADEGTFFTRVFGMTRSQETVDKFLSAFGEARPHIEQIYPGIADVERHTGNLVSHPVSRFLHDALFEGPVRFLADTLSTYTKVQVHLYESRAILPAWATLDVGVHHFAEVPFVFHSSSLWADDKNGAEEEETARMFGERWTRFALTGSPESTDAAAWPAYTQDAKQKLVFEQGKEHVESVEKEGGAGLVLLSSVIKTRWSIQEKKAEVMSKM